MHVRAPTAEQLPWLQRLLRRQFRRYGQVFVPAQVRARVPALHAALTGLYAARDHWRDDVCFDAGECAALECAEAITGASQAIG